jgi:hypothetical protein
MNATITNTLKAIATKDLLGEGAELKEFTGPDYAHLLNLTAPCFGDRVWTFNPDNGSVCTASVHHNVPETYKIDLAFLEASDIVARMQRIHDQVDVPPAEPEPEPEPEPKDHPFVATVKKYFSDAETTDNEDIAGFIALHEEHPAFKLLARAIGKRRELLYEALDEYDSTGQAICGLENTLGGHNREVLKEWVCGEFGLIDGSELDSYLDDIESAVSSIRYDI